MECGVIIVADLSLYTSPLPFKSQQPLVPWIGYPKIKVSISFMRGAFNGFPSDQIVRSGLRISVVRGVEF